MGVPCIFVSMKRNSARLIGETKLGLDPIGDPLPLVPAQRLLVGGPDLHVKERLLGTGRVGHHVNGAESVADIVDLRSPEDAAGRQPDF